MIHELDETIREILTKGGGLNPAEVDISFEIPNREWSTGISKPTLNCYLFDIRENRELRQYGMEAVGTGSGAQTRFARTRPSLRFDLTYLVTAWTRAVEDEHRLLWHALQTLTRFETLPQEYLQGNLREVESPISARTALPESVLKSPGEFWTALENQIKPSLSYVITLMMSREQLPAGPPVLTSTLRFPWPGGVDLRPSWFGGVVRDKQGQPIPYAQVQVEGTGTQGTTDAQGRFRLRVPRPGTYTLIAQDGQRTQRLQFTIDEPAFDIDLT
ncbi:MAG: hypothetical protein Fur005_23010 [Roseiflexaceae bacterium]